MKEILIKHPKGKRPMIELKVQRVEPNVWKKIGFHNHHYLTAALNPSCKCLLFTWNGQPIAFVGLLNTPRKGIPYGMSVSRIVIHPDFQGLGLFKQIMDFCGKIVKSLSDDEHEYKLYIKTAHRKAAYSLNNNPNWKGTAFDGKGRTKESTESEGTRYKNRLMRVSACKEYIGDRNNGYQDILLPIKEMRDAKKKIKQLEIQWDDFS